MKDRAREVREIGDNLFSKRRSLLSRWQDIADHFYPERADFVVQRVISTDFAGHLMTGVPALARRDLANAFSAMLRPRGQQWFTPRTADEKINEDVGAQRWLDWAGDVMRRAMYDNSAHFVRATKEADNDFAAFGQSVLTVDLNASKDGLLYRSWHLRDVCWAENAALEIDTIHRDQKIPARQLVKLFPKTVSQKVKDLLDKEPFRGIKCRHVIMPAEEYYDADDEDSKGQRRKISKLPVVSIWIDCENDVVMEEPLVRRSNYVIPRWQTVSGSQYAHSPATVIAIPDARLLQQMTLTLLEAGQKAVDPPLIAVGEMIQGGVNTFAGGVTWVDAEYDERFGEVMRPMTIDKTGLQFGIDREERIRTFIQKAFFLDQLELPGLTGEKMTATETQIRMEEYMRRALPLFEPMETEYNGALCNHTFELMMENGAFGSPFDIPQQLQGQDIRWQFESPIQAAASRANAKAFGDSMSLLTMAAQIDPNAAHIIDVDKALKDAMEGAGAPAEWFRTDEEKAAMDQQAVQAQQLQQAATQIGGAAQVAEQVGNAGQSLAAAGIA